MRPAFGVALIGLTLAAPASAYTLVRVSAAGGPLHWPAGVPVMMQLNDQIGSSTPNVTAASDPLGAIERSLAKYPAVSAAEFAHGTTSVASSGRDGVNVISFADTAANRQAFEMAGGDAVIGLTLFFFTGSTIIEADLLFNPALQFTTTIDDDRALQTANAFDVEAVATHELGHVLGLHHSGVESAVMWPLSSVLQRTLDADDIAGIRVLYPADSGRGAIAGNVSVGATPAFGAQVVARRSDGTVAASALTLPNGSYRIEALAPATYDVYAEPLDGPQAAVPDVPCIRIGNLSGAGIYNGATLTDDFATQFTESVAVNADATATVNFTPSAGAPPINPVQIGTATGDLKGSISASIAGVPVPLAAGSDQLLTVAGPGIDQVTAAAIDLGPGVHVDGSDQRMLTFTCNGNPLPAIVFAVHVDADAPAGGRSVVIATGDGHVAMTGAVRVSSPAAPVCIGDCDGGGSVTVNELVKLVNIALGVIGASCPNGIGDATEVTVPLIVHAVNNLLNGC